MPSYASGFSEHPNSGEAAGESVGQIQQALNGGSPNFLLALISGQHTRDFVSIAESLRSLLTADTFVAATAGTVISQCRHLEQGSGIALWATDASADVFPMGQNMADEIADIPVSGTMILLADSVRFRAEQYLHEIAGSSNGQDPLNVLGGFLSAQSNQIFINEGLYSGGAAGICFSPDVAVQNIVSQGFRPVGQPFTVTSAEANKIISLGGQPPIKRLSQTFGTLEPKEKEYLKANLHVGLAVRENKLDLERGDFLIRAVTALHKSGEMEIAHMAQTGDLLQFQLLDPAAALEDLSSQLEQCNASSALMFACNGRGHHLYGESDMESDLVYSRLAENSKQDVSVVGMSCAGEIAPVSNQNYIHGFTTTLALFK